MRTRFCTRLIPLVGYNDRLLQPTTRPHSVTKSNRKEEEKEEKKKKKIVISSSRVCFNKPGVTVSALFWIYQVKIHLLYDLSTHFDTPLLKAQTQQHLLY